MLTVNRLVLAGNVGSIDPKEKFVRISVATERLWRDEFTGETKKKTEWNSVSFFNPAHVKYISEQLEVGDRVYIEARVELTSYDRDGQTVYVTNINADIFQNVDHKKK